MTAGAERSGWSESAGTARQARDWAPGQGSPPSTLVRIVATLPSN